MSIIVTPPITRSQKSSAITSIEQIIGFVQRSGISNLYPEIYDHVNFDEFLKLLFELRDAPQRVLKSDQEVMQTRQQRKIAQIQAMQAGQLQQSQQLSQ